MKSILTILALFKTYKSIEKTIVYGPAVPLHCAARSFTTDEQMRTAQTVLSNTPLFIFEMTTLRLFIASKLNNTHIRIYCTITPSGTGLLAMAVDRITYIREMAP